MCNKCYAKKITRTDITVQSCQEQDEEQYCIRFSRHERECEAYGAVLVAVVNCAVYGRLCAFDVNDQKAEDGHEDSQQIQGDDAEPESVPRTMESPVHDDHNADNQINWNALGILKITCINLFSKFRNGF